MLPEKGPATARPRPRPTGGKVASACSFERLGDLLRVSLMLAEQAEARFEQRFQLRILGRRDQGRFKRAVDGLVIGDLVVDVGAVVFGTAQMAEALERCVRALAETLARRIVLRRNVKLLDQRKRLDVHRLVV